MCQGRAFGAGIIRLALGRGVVIFSLYLLAWLNDTNPPLHRELGAFRSIGHIYSRVHPIRQPYRLGRKLPRAGKEGESAQSEGFVF